MKSYITLSLLMLLIIGASGLYWFVLLNDSPHTEEYTSSVDNSTETQSTTTTASASQATSSEKVTSHASSTVTLSGVFLSLQEVQTEWRSSYMTMLLDDGTEIMRVDLRPILGSDIRDVSQKLGIERGERVEIEGSVNDEGSFRASVIQRVATE